MGNQCCGQPAEGQGGIDYEVNNKKYGGQDDGRNPDNFEHSTIRSTFKNKIEEINEKEVVFKSNFQVGEGATYTGQMKLVADENGEQQFIKHGKGK